jgi:hypothetical protein
VKRGGLLVSFLWALVFASVAFLAMLWIGADHNLAGGLAFAIGRLPRYALLVLAGPDADKNLTLYAVLTGLFVFVIALPLTHFGAARRESDARPGVPRAPIILAALILWEVGYLLFGEMPRNRLGDWRTSFFVPWHLAALAITTGYLLLSKKLVLPQWSYRGYWLAMFLMGLYVLFPMTDSP